MRKRGQGDPHRTNRFTREIRFSRTRRLQRCSSGSNGDLHDAVALAHEEIVRVLDLPERKAVRHQLLERRAAGGDDAHQPAHALYDAREIQDP